MVRESALREAAEEIIVGVAIVSVANLLGGLIASAIGLVGVVVYLLIVLPALYYALVYVLRGLGIFLEDVLDERTNGADVGTPFDSGAGTDPGDVG